MSRKPDYRVAALNKVTNDKNNIGAGWTNQDGSIAVVLDAFIHLEASRNLLITLFPNTEHSS